ncbi:MAG: Gfo/Idh/MocA family oxidoreductase [Chloroflexi bacterium]|nr:Gfo/Idh/MocA family oxidoreductase [Chloroflexota bacterium]
MSTSIRFGIVGTGGIANTHAAALAALAADAELTACCDVDPTRTADFSERWGVRHQYDSARAMLDAGQIDVVCVCTPHPQHADPLVLAAERGIHGIVEKPMTATVAAADRVLEAAARHGTLISTMSQRRWFPAAQRIRRAIDDGKLGPRLLLGESVTEMWRDEAYYRRDAWRGKWDSEGGGVLMNQAPHNIDLLLWYMGSAEEIYGYWGNLNHPYVEVEDNAVAVIKFRSGALGVLKGTTSMNPERRLHGVTLVGDSGATVSLDCWQVSDSERRVNSGPWDVGSNDIWTIPNDPQGPINRAAAVDYNSGELPNFHAHQLQDIIAAIRDKRPPAVTGQDGRRVVAVIQGVYESGRHGRPVKLSD